MDDIKPNQSLDGMQSGRSPQAGSVGQSADVSGSTNNNGGLNQFNDADYAPTDSSEQQHATYNDQPQHSEPMKPNGGSGMALKLLLTLFVILFVVALAAAGYFYMQNNKKDTSMVNSVDVSKLQQENDALTYDNKTLKTQNAHFQVLNKSLSTTAQQLKTKCGSGCSAIVIPQ